MWGHEAQSGRDVTHPEPPGSFHRGLPQLRRHLAALAVRPAPTSLRRPLRSNAFPQADWKRLRSTNGLERLHGEVKRRIRSVGAFPDRASALRLITAVALEVTGVRDDRRYLDMSLLSSPKTKGSMKHRGASPADYTQIGT